MSLSKYKQKRNFSESPEPAGKKESTHTQLRFVIQKHDASSLHYDLRLEMEGVLKSWAVPKGPSLNPSDKRLAMMVEDHPYSYRTFEGIIPEGNYGAGTVIVWDEGTYEPADSENLSADKKHQLLLKSLAAGNLKIVLHGQKLKGLFALFRLKRGEEKQWLLVKKSDDFATESDITKKDKSVLSGKTIAVVAKENGTVLKHPDKKENAKKTVVQTIAKKSTVPKKERAKTKGDDAKLPVDLKPMLATLVDAPFDGPDWLFEIKWDGYRAVAHAYGDEVEIISRNKKSFTNKYRPVTEALQHLGIEAVLDGEIVAVNEEGLADFQLLQNWKSSPEANLQYYVFDLLWLNGKDITNLPLVERKKALQQLIPADNPIIKYSDHVVGDGNAFFDVALKKGLEGIMAKKCDSTYTIGQRTADWVKIKVTQRQEVVIGGFTQPRNTRQFFGALLLGAYQKGELVYVGHTGSGFNNKSLEAIYTTLQKLVVDKCPFEKCPKGNMPVTWVKPKLVCEIKFTEWTKDNIARHPIFMGLRQDKNAKDVIIEKTQTMATAVKKSSTSKGATAKKVAAKKTAAKKGTSKSSAAKKAAPKKTSAPKKAPAKDAKKTPTAKRPGKNAPLQLAWEEETEQRIILNDQELTLTNLNKLYWKKEKVAKGDLINHYLRMAPYILPYMKGRPQSLNRHPNGIAAPNFFQKDMRGKVPDWMATHDDFSESTNTTVRYLVCDSEAALIYMANLGCIEMNPWHSRIQSVDNPDWCLIDLDPDTPNTFNQVIDTALVVKKVLDAVGATACVKTSGSTGIHIYIPLGAAYSYEQSKQLAELIVTIVHQELPELTSLERSPKNRKGKIYLDYLQNRPTQTAAAPYCLRPKPGVPVSTPLHWDELKKGLTITTYNMHNIFERVQSEGDLFKPVLGKGINLQNVLLKMQALIG